MSINLNYDFDSEKDEELWKTRTSWTNQDFESWKNAGKQNANIVKKVKDLSLRHYTLENLDDIIPFFTNLISLSLDDNTLSSIPDNIGTLTKLQNLDITNNNIEIMPYNIGNLTQLKSLIFVNNELKGLPESIGNLSDLVSLDVMNNQLKTIPRSIVNLRKLTYLNIERNMLSRPVVSIIPSLSSNTQLRIYDDDQRVDDESESATEYDSNASNEDEYYQPNEDYEAELTTSNVTINTNQEGFDVIEGNMKIIDFINSDENNIAFKLKESVYLVSMDTIKQYYQTSICYQCFEVGDMNPENLNIHEEEILFNVRNIGLPINYVYLSQINTILNNRPSTYYVLEDLHIHIASVAKKDSILRYMEDGSLLASSSHCQEGQGGDVYNISIAKPVTSGGRGKSKTRKIKIHTKTTKHHKKSNKSNKSNKSIKVKKSKKKSTKTKHQKRK